ncbi:MAG: leucyl aminopeptidase family protein [Steroidobacteraceae bacterium]
MSQEMLLSDDPADSRPLWIVTEGELQSWLASQPGGVVAWVRAHGFQAERHRVLSFPSPEGGGGGAVLGLGSLRSAHELTLWHSAGLSDRLPAQLWHLATGLQPRAATHFLLGWIMGGYRMMRYRLEGSEPPRAVLVPPPGADLRYAGAAARATALARDLINTPANDMGPQELADAALDLARSHGARCQVLAGGELAGYPMLRAVGGASCRPPRLIDLRWGEREAARVTLVGKGVCFDSGGLDLKTSAAMLLMKKDMGGAACALGLADLIMRLEVPVQLRVLIPAVENSVGGAAYRPGDVLRSRKGLTVEVGNTDAEGRLVLADALAEADLERPDLLIDLATLTGAARTALGPELPAAYSPSEELLDALRRHGEEESDPVWPLPLWPGYEEDLASKVADLGNVASTPFAGSIIAALFLKRFVTETPNWLHLDLYAWNGKERPGRPVGAEAQCVRSLFELIRSRYR